MVDPLHDWKATKRLYKKMTGEPKPALSREERAAIDEDASLAEKGKAQLLKVYDTLGKKMKGNQTGVEHSIGKLARLDPNFQAVPSVEKYGKLLANYTVAANLYTADLQKYLKEMKSSGQDKTSRPKYTAIKMLKKHLVLYRKVYEERYINLQAATQVGQNIEDKLKLARRHVDNGIAQFLAAATKIKLILSKKDSGEDARAYYNAQVPEAITVLRNGLKEMADICSGGNGVWFEDAKRQSLAYYKELRNYQTGSIHDDQTLKTSMAKVMEIVKRCEEWLLEAIKAFGVLDAVQALAHQ